MNKRFEKLRSRILSYLSKKNEPNLTLTDVFKALDKSNAKYKTDVDSKGLFFIYKKRKIRWIQGAIVDCQSLAVRSILYNLFKL